MITLYLNLELNQFTLTDCTTFIFIDYKILNQTKKITCRPLSGEWIKTINQSHHFLFKSQI